MSEMPIALEAFGHEAHFSQGTPGFLEGAVPFIRDGVAVGEPVMVAVSPEKIALLRAELGDEADGVVFTDMRDLGRNPGRIIPAWHDFLDEHRRAPGRVRGVGEPIWPGRSPAELVESQLHESLLNLAFAAADGFRLLCMYDVDALEDDVLDEACCSHPTIHDAAGTRDSLDYRGDEELLAPHDVPLTRPPTPAETLRFEHRGLPEVRTLILRGAGRVGLSAAKTDDLVLAASEIAANSVRHGGGRGVFSVWREDDALVCEFRDRGHISDPLAGRKKPDVTQSGGWGLWLAHRVCDLVQLRSRPDGTVVRLHMYSA